MRDEIKPVLQPDVFSPKPDIFSPTSSTQLLPPQNSDLAKSTKLSIVGLSNNLEELCRLQPPNLSQGDDSTGFCGEVRQCIWY